MAGDTEKDRDRGTAGGEVREGVEKREREKENEEYVTRSNSKQRAASGS